MTICNMSICSRLLRRGLLPLAVAFSVAGAAPALAQSEPTAMQRILGSIGLLELPKDPIEYRERPPLVVPPSSGLIPPRGADDMARHNPDWPVDHDARRPRTAQDVENERRTEDTFYTGGRLDPAELQRGRITREELARRQQKQTPVDVFTANQALGPAGLGFKGWGAKNKEERVVFTGEPERRSLTEPPPGLRTPSLNAPYGVVSNRPEALKEDLLHSHDPRANR